MNKMQKLVSVLSIGMTLLTAAPAMAVSTGQLDLSAEGQLGAVQNSLGVSNQDVRVTIARIIRVAMGLLGIIAVVIILIGGFTWMTAGGNEDKVGEAKKWIYSGVIGLAIILSAYAIASFVINSLTAATAGA